MITAARWISLIAAFVVGAVAEYNLARMVGYDRFTAGLLPLVLDVYGFAAFKVGRRGHVFTAVLALFGVQMVSHLMTMGHGGNPAHVALSILVSGIAPGVSWACHKLEGESEEVAAEEVVADAPREPLTTEQIHAATQAYGPVFSAPAIETVEDFTPVDVRPYLTQIDDAAAKLADLVADADDETPEPSPTKADVAARARELIAGGMKKTDVATELGVSRAWMYTCLREVPA